MVANDRLAHILAELNPEQREAATTTSGNLFISAGAGTGKTKTLTAHYVSCLLAMQEDDPSTVGAERILAITYTKAAAAELTERIKSTLRDVGRDDLARKMGDAWISTIHSFCQRVLRNEAPALTGDAATDPLFVTLDPLEAKAIRAQAIDEVFDRWAFDQPERLSQLLGEKSRASIESSVAKIMEQRSVWGYGTDRVIVPSALPNREMPIGSSAGRYSWDERATAIAIDVVEMSHEAAAKYQSLKAERSALDYGDLIHRVAQLFEESATIAARYRAQFSRIIIDEFQDTNALQYSVFQSISDDNLSIVGDKNQSIYAFQGAQADVFDQARADVSHRASGGFLLELGSNYRSHSDVLAFANTAFTSAEMFGDEGLVRLRHARDEERSGTDALARTTLPARVVLAPILGDNAKSDSDEELRKLGAAEREAVWIADWVERLHRHQDPPVRLSDIKVVVRSRSGGRLYAEELRSRNIPALVIGGTGLLNDPIVRGTLALVRVLDNPADEAALVQLLISPYGRVPDQELADLRFAAQTLAQRARELRDSRAAGNTTADGSGVTTVSHPDAAAGLWTAIGDAVAEGAAHPELDELFKAVSLARDSLGVISLDETLRSIATQRGVDLMLLAPPPADGTSALERRQSYENLMRFIEMAGQWDRAGGTPRTFVSEIEGFIEEKDTLELPLWSDGAEAGEAISIMTIHATKGLEFPVVIFPTATWDAKPKFEGACRIGHVHEPGETDGGSGGKLWVTASVKLTREEEATCKGSSKATLEEGGITGSSGDRTYHSVEHRHLASEHVRKELEEARRLMYVAVTRARDMVVVGHRVAGREPDSLASPKTGAQVWHRMVKDRFIDGDYPDYELRAGVTSFAIELDPSMLTQSTYANAQTNGLSGWPSANYAKQTRREAAGGTVETDFGDGGCAPIGARHLELVAKQATAPSGLSQVSASHLTVYSRCPRQYYLQYFSGAGTLRNKNPNDEANRGNALHAILERSTETESLDNDMARRILKASRIDVEHHEDILNQASALLATDSLTELREGGFAVHTERQFYEHITAAPGGEAEGASVCLQGYIDVFAQGADGAVRVLDYKSGKGADREHYEIQARCYALVGLRSGSTSVEVRFLMPGARDDATAKLGDAELDGAIPFHRFEFTAEDRSDIEAEILEAAKGMVRSGAATQEQLEGYVEFDTCDNCGFKGPLCEVGARRFH